MRLPTRVLRCLVILCALGAAPSVHADDRSDARAHYQAGVKFYSDADYRNAIREFSAAQQLAPADLNNYNLALCYDKLGDPEPAIQYYRAFLDKQPSTDKRAEIEASVSRLEAAAQSVASKKADEARKVDEARKADEARPAEVPPLPAPRPRGPAVAPTPEDLRGLEDSRSGGDRSPPPRATGGSVGSPGNPRPARTGDAQLDRANSINIDELRDHRLGGAGASDARGPGGPTAAGPVAPGPNGPSNMSGAGPSNPNGPSMASNDRGQPVPGHGGDAAPPERPVYTKWWFWVVLGVSGYVVYELATDSSSQSVRGRTSGSPPPPLGGVPLLRW